MIKIDMAFNGGSIFLDACWWLWRARNKLCLANVVVSSYTLILIIVNYENILAKCFLKHNMSHPTRMITWNTQKGSNIILNVDGSSIGNPSVSGFGGLVRNADGAWVHNFAGNIGYSNILHVELIMLYHGLRITVEAIKWQPKLISEFVKAWHHYVAILHNIKELPSRE
ncbi:unnamed protein product [Vicia faba]|uniref:RNase H type-1 domain-containing protein n=1 Tax=Vicia faba TaxID=3906 RepID=A0AAV1AQI5_VICFA|nr:unnamed protein product [Vicia faba]